MKIEYAEDQKRTKKENRKLKREFKRFQRKLNKKSTTAKKNWNTLVKSEHIHTIHLNQVDDKNEKMMSVRNKDGYVKGKGGGTDIFIHMNLTSIEGRDEKTPIIAIGHEEGHAIRVDQGLQEVVPELEFSLGGNMDGQIINNMIIADQIKVTEEIEASHIENIIRAEIDPTGKIHPLRKKYSNIIQKVNRITRKIQISQIDVNVIKDGYRYYK